MVSAFGVVLMFWSESGCFMRDVTDVCRNGGGNCPWYGPHIVGLSPNMLLL